MTEAELLFSEALGCRRHELYLNYANALLGKEKGHFISQALLRRAAGEPLQYILGNTEFMGLRFMVRPPVFIPRPESELLVERALELAEEAKGELHILDMCTGSGCLAISLAKLLSAKRRLVAVDISPEAISLARDNALALGVAEEVHLLVSDLFSALKPSPFYDMIICNPPYIATSDISFLEPELRWESLAALDGGEDGLFYIRKIVTEAGVYLRSGGFLILEVGYNQAEMVTSMAKKIKCWKVIQTTKDYLGWERVMVMQYGPTGN